MSKNKAILIGRLGADPEVRYTPDGTCVCNFSLATDEKWTDKNTGEKQQRTEWHRIVAWRKLAEICGEYLVKGKQIYCEGTIRTRSWEKDGITRYTTEITIDDMIMLSDPGQSNRRQGPNESGQAYGGQHPGGSARNDDDIPF
jgi:single-strand DNA-binding protein